MSSADPSAGLPAAEFAVPGPLRDQLVAAILEGRKVSTTSLLLDYERDGTPLPLPGQRSIVLDSHGRGVTVIEVTSVSVVPLGDVDLGHVADEGEGHETVASWRADHERFWQSRAADAAPGERAVPVDDRTPVVLERFIVVQPLAGRTCPNESD